MTLRAILEFYQQLKSVMPHYDSNINTTADVVRGAIIPMTKSSMCAYADMILVQDGEETRFPDKLCSHNWGNLFRDMIAALVADALGECDYASCTYFLDHAMKSLLGILQSGNKLGLTYWICAFAVNSKFGQVIAVDHRFGLVDRAWCMKEIAKAFELGIPQSLKIYSAAALEKHKPKLKEVKIAKMQASRPEDVKEILSTIDDEDAFNFRLQELLFDERTGLLQTWRHLD